MERRDELHTSFLVWKLLKKPASRVAATLAGDTFHWVILTGLDWTGLSAVCAFEHELHNFLQEGGKVLGFQLGTLGSQNKNKTDERNRGHFRSFKHSESCLVYMMIYSLAWEVLWSRKMDSVAVLDNGPVLPADSLRQYMYI